MSHHTQPPATAGLSSPGSEMFCIDIDLTELKEAERALIQAKEQAEAANKAKSEFLATMSHELRTPFNGIMGILQLLETTLLNAEQKKYIEMAMKASDRYTVLLTDLLEISTIEAGSMAIQETEFCLKELCASVHDLFKATAKEKGVDLRCSLDLSTPASLIGDAMRVKQILFNLVGNALKFTNQGLVNVEMALLSSPKEQDARILFSVADTGIGIPEDKLNLLFKPFVQVDGSYTRRYQGAGLGLAVVRRMVEMMNGNISIESCPGEGTTVHVALPFRRPGDVSR